MNDYLPPFEYSIYRNTIIKTVISFVYDHLPLWRDNPYITQEITEPVLTNNLVTYLLKRASLTEQNFLFVPEDPQSNRHTIDFAVFLVGEEDDYRPGKYRIE